MTTDPSDETPKKKPLSEIGHLFLSSVRDQHLGGMPRPQRIPPGGAPKQPLQDVSIDLTPAEFAEMMGAPAPEATVAAAARRTPPVTAIIGEHLNGKQLARVKDYARHLAASAGGRIGLIALDGSEFRLMCFEPGEQPNGPIAEQPIDNYDTRGMAEAIEELNFDVDRWLLLIPTPRVTEAQPLLKQVDHWVLLSTCDHDGIVSSYRMLKGLAEVHRPRLSLSVLDAADAAQAEKVYLKLAGVCQQFLDRALEAETPVRKDHAVGVCEHPVMLCRPTRDKAQLANAPQWQIVSEFLASIRPSDDAVVSATNVSAKPLEREVIGEMVVPAASMTQPVPVTQQEAAPVAEVTTMPEMTQSAAAQTPVATADAGPAEIVDLPAVDASAEQIVSAVLRQDGTAMLECPVRPPMCADARLAVTRDRGVVLLAVAKRGLAELSTIGQAYRWLVENRSLIGMAVPQLAIDPAQTPRLRLLVDQTDAGAEVLQPMLSGDHVAVQSYRRVRWGGKAGLLLEAA